MRYDELMEMAPDKNLSDFLDPKSLEILDFLDDGDVLSILLFLKGNKPVSVSDFHRKFQNVSDLDGKMKKFMVYNLVYVQNSSVVDSGYIMLTPQGDKVADIMDLMVDVIAYMDEDLGESDSEDE